ncbi:MAG: thioredoxin family protein [Burkholderiaceae bacterium]|jgi:thiol:disulfide interchange protein DsbD|nr:thioredoxin family protein [Burkholderiaceae bacterium]
MRRPSTLLAAAFALLGCSAASAASPSAVVVTPQVRTELVVHAPDGVVPGRTIALGLLIDHQPGWHTYWKNPGDAGLPTTFAWTLPAGVSAGEIAWPTPQRVPLGPLMNYGYDGRLLLPVPISIPPGFAAEALEIALRAEWLVCKDICIPEGGEFALRVPARAASASHAAEFDAAKAAIPVTLPDAAASAEVAAGALKLRVTGLPPSWKGRELAFFPEVGGVIHNAALPRARWDGEAWLAELPLDPQRSAGPSTIPAVLTAPGAIAGVQIEVAVAGEWPAVGAAAAAPSSGAAASAGQDGAGGPAPPGAAAASGALGLPLALLFAVAGGALLNLMPCVFPVLSLKVLGFAQHAGERARLLAGGLAYSAGVVVSFLALAGLLLALRAGGEQLGWGFQLQSPLVVAALAALFTIIGLNLAGVFEFGQMLPDRLATMQLRHPLADSALTGVLAVAVAAPCTAPFMGAALGFAVTLPAPQALAVFGALGIGMALPYLAASAWPALARALPRPGPWMATFKGLMAFPMFATVVWLIWVLGQQAGIDAVAALLGTLVALAFLAWGLGGVAHARRTRSALGGVGALLLAAALAWTLPALRSDAGAAMAAADGDWQPWSAERVAAATGSGQAVFVDFTAAWCVTCQFNKRTTLADARVDAAFAERRVLRLRADWTRRDDAITAELARLGRSGVPVYALYAPGGGAPTLLSEILSVDEVRGALAALP